MGGRSPQLRLGGVESLDDLLGVQRHQRADVLVKIHHDHGVGITGMPGHRRHPADTALGGREHTGDMHQGLHADEVDERLDLVFAAQVKQVVEQPGLGLTDELGQGDGGQHVA